LHKILKVESHKPRLPVPPVEDDRRAVSEVFSIPLGLLHPFGDFKLLASFALDVDSRQSYQVGHRAIVQRFGRLYISKSVFVSEEGGKLPFCCPPLTL